MTTSQLSAYTPPAGRAPEFQFYPTPEGLIYALIRPYYSTRTTVLEPSAGRGDIADILRKSRDKEVSVCEISADLRAILAAKGHRIIGTDFLTMEAPYSFGLVVMNPPFARCAEHVCKAWSVLLPDGDLATILPRSAIGKDTGKFAELNQLIELFGAVEEIGAAFKAAERKTDADCVIVRLKKPAAKPFTAFESFNPAQDAEYQAPEERDLPAPRDLIRAITQQYREAMRVLKIKQDAEIRLRSLIPESGKRYVRDADTPVRETDYLKAAFWDLVFDRTQIAEKAPSGFREDFMQQREKLARMEFSEETIYEVLHRFIQNKDKIMEQCIMDLFTQITRYSRDNVVQSEQWATNKMHKITPKIIVPGAVGIRLGGYAVKKEDFLNDLDKALAMFGVENGVSTVKAAQAVMDRVNEREFPYTGKFETPNFYFRFYQKGTMHLWFRDLKALEMINRYAAERRLFTLGSGR